MPNYTPNFKLKKPLGSESYNIEDQNGNMDVIEAALSDCVRQTGYAAATGSANIYLVTLAPAPALLVDGICVVVKINVANTGASTINVNGLGAKAIKKSNGNDVAAGNLKPGVIYTLRYNATAGNFILQGEGGEYGTATANEVRIGYTIGTEDGIIEGTYNKTLGSGDVLSLQDVGLDVPINVPLKSNMNGKEVVVSGDYMYCYSGTTLYKYDLSGNLVASRPNAVGYTIKDIVVVGNYIYLIADAYLYRISTSLATTYDKQMNASSNTCAMFYRQDTNTIIIMLYMSSYGVYEVNLDCTADWYHYVLGNIGSLDHNMVSYDAAHDIIYADGNNQTLYIVNCSTWTSVSKSLSGYFSSYDNSSKYIPEYNVVLIANFDGALLCYDCTLGTFKWKSTSTYMYQSGASNGHIGCYADCGSGVVAIGVTKGSSYPILFIDIAIGTEYYSHTDMPDTVYSMVAELFPYILVKTFTYLYKVFVSFKIQ